MFQGYAPIWGFPGGSVVKKIPANAGDAEVGSIPGLGRSLGEGNGNELGTPSLYGPRATTTEAPGV